MAPWERARVRRGVVEARTMGARISELRKRWLADSRADSWERSILFASASCCGSLGGGL